MEHAFLVAGLAYGDEGKGATVDALVRHHKAGLVIRYNGGSQCAHNVVTPRCRHHTFAQFGSGSFIPNVRTHLSQYVVVDPWNMMNEEKALRAKGVDKMWYRTTIHPKAVIVTPFHKAMNQIRAGLSKKNNTCGMGIGETRDMQLKYGEQVLYARDLFSKYAMGKKLEFIQYEAYKFWKDCGGHHSSSELLKKYKSLIVDKDFIDKIVENFVFPTWVINGDLKEILDSTQTVVFEGAQGVLLDETYGEDGFNTWTNTTFENAESVLQEHQPEVARTKIGVMRGFLTRHGDGPFPEEKENLYDDIPEPHNGDTGLPGKFRKAGMDFSLIRKSLGIVRGVDCLAVNHLEYFGEGMVELVERELNTPVWVEGRGPSCKQRKFTELPVLA